MVVDSSSDSENEADTSRNSQDRLKNSPVKLGKVDKPAAAVAQKVSNKQESRSSEDVDMTPSPTCETKATVAVPSASLSCTVDFEVKEDQPVAFSSLCKCFEMIEATTKRLEISSILTKLFVDVICHSPKDLISIVYLCINRVC